MIHDDTSVRPAFLPPRAAHAAHPDLELAMTVNEALRRIPNAGLVFNAFGVDACCGGGNTLDAAARDAGIDPAVLLDALASVVDAEGAR
jgi:regulator of cell morphogenesis and NO signaling